MTPNSTIGTRARIHADILADELDRAAERMPGAQRPLHHVHGFGELLLDLLNALGAIAHYLEEWQCASDNAGEQRDKQIVRKDPSGHDARNRESRSCEHEPMREE
jgi:hypothetical protein